MSPRTRNDTLEAKAGVAGSTADSSPWVVIDMAPYLDSNSFSFASDLVDGSLNVWKNTLPAEELPQDRLLFARGVPFICPRVGDGELNDVLCAGQYVAVPEGRYDWVYVIVGGERRSEDFVYFHFTDGACDPEWLRVSDFWPGPSHFGEPAAIRFRALHYPNHVENRLSPTLWLQRVPVTRMTGLMAIRLPENRSMHLFGATLMVSALTPDGAGDPIGAGGWNGADNPHRREPEREQARTIA